MMNYKARDLQGEILFIDLFHLISQRSFLIFFILLFVKYLTAPWDIKLMFKRSQNETQFG